ncbi:MAG: LysO family transporter [Methanosphaera sp.]|nr:LysO family transporter [Methanosphaera sp.]
MISLITIVGMALERVIPWNIQAIIYISLIGIFVAIPGVPTADFIVHYVSQIELTTICTAFLAYVGIAIGNDWEEFKKIGWKGIIIAMIVITGTYLGSASIADAVLVLTGMI